MDSIINCPPDIQSYLTEIAERLWTGHASVMVGAGLSKNADNIINPAKKMPDWGQLGDLFFEKLYNQLPDGKTKYLSLLKLAEEFEATFGRAALEQFVQKNVSDNEYEPSDVHIKLMTLPWSDVFTTNYDTLLERSCREVISRKYDIVVNQNDLVYSNKPRIVKLHGSFPSERPFIITEEDYRIYPKKYAPFVNTVQQSLLENTLCLIGFSGDDPNFLQWIGWINDNIGKSNAAKIYLVGVLNLSESQKKLLHNKNIITIDLSTCEEVRNDHKKGLAFFINYLTSQRNKRENLEWPIASDIEISNRISTKALIKKWAACRVKYPSWLILPQQKRDILWTYTEEYCSDEDIFDKLPPFKDLDYIYELNWRMERCLAPIWNVLAPHFQRILNRYNFFPESISEKREFNTIDLQTNNLNREQYQDKWVHLSLALLRFYREENFDNQWEDTQRIITQIQPQLSAEQIAQFYYEQILRAIFKLKQQEAKKILNEWPQNNISPFWNAKRAMLLIEFGQYKEATQILESSLTAIRKKLNLSPVENDYSWVSQEAYVMLLLRTIQLNNFSSDYQLETLKDLNKKWSEQSERWNDLLQYKCDPWGEKKYFDLMLQRPFIPEKNTSIEDTFEIGRRIRSFSIGRVSKDFVIAYAFLRYQEELAIPLSLSVSFDDKTMIGLLKRVKPVSPTWGTALLHRLTDSKAVDAIFDRKYLMYLSVATINEYVKDYISHFEVLLPEYDSNEIAKAFIGKLPMILSRLCTKCDERAKIEIAKFYQKISKLYLQLADKENLIINLIDSSSKSTLSQVVTILLDTPIQDQDLLYFKEPFDYLYTREIELAQKPNPELLENIFQTATEKGNTRGNAIKRLMFLYNNKQLNSRQAKKLFDIIWQKTDDRYGFPMHTTLYHYAYFKYPIPNGIDVKIMYKKYISKDNFTIQNLEQNLAVTRTGGRSKYVQELLGGSLTFNNTEGIKWNLSELESILSKCEQWWSLDKSLLTNEEHKLIRLGGSIYDEFIDRFKNLTRIIARVFGHQRQNLSTELQKRIEKLITDMDMHNIPVLQAKVVFGLYDKSWFYLSELPKALISTNRSIVIDALESAILTVHYDPLKEKNFLACNY